jgi:hypothetical protein
MEFDTIPFLRTELTVSIDFTDDMLGLSKLSKSFCNAIWCNGGNCRTVTLAQFKELHRTATLLKLAEDETEIKKGQPPQHRIYWDDCPALPSDLSQLLNHSDEPNDQSTDESVGN